MSPSRSSAARSRASAARSRVSAATSAASARASRSPTSMSRRTDLSSRSSLRRSRRSAARSRASAARSRSSAVRSRSSATRSRSWATRSRSFALCTRSAISTSPAPADRSPIPRSRCSHPREGSGSHVSRLSQRVPAAYARACREGPCGGTPRPAGVCLGGPDRASVRHGLLHSTPRARQRARSPAVLTIGLVGQVLRVEVADQSDTPPTSRAPGPGTTGGRGMHLIGSIAQKWGVLPARAGKGIWFELSAAG